MLDNLFSGVFDTAAVTISPVNFLLCMGVSLVLGLALCAMTMWHSRSSGSYAVTLALLPAVVCVVIMMVNGNVGAGVAVALEVFFGVGDGFCLPQNQQMPEPSNAWPSVKRLFSAISLRSLAAPQSGQG